MELWIQMVTTVLASVLAASGFWALITKLMDKKDTKTRMIVGLGHDRILNLGMEYIKRGWITQDEYENLHEYLYKPYKELGGNGSAERIMKEVDKLPIRPADYRGPSNGQTERNERAKQS